jgi:hypothetical protein
MGQAPGFTAEASLYRSQGQYRTRRSGSAQTAVVPSQIRSVNYPRRPWFGVVNDCPPGQRLVHVPDKWVPKYCKTKRLEYDLGLMMWIEVESEYECGWTHAPAHWECQLPSLSAIP